MTAYLWVITAIVYSCVYVYLKRTDKLNHAYTLAGFFLSEVIMSKPINSVKIIGTLIVFAPIVFYGFLALRKKIMDKY